MLTVVALTGVAAAASAQSIEIRQWQGGNAYMRQPEQVMANTMAEWRSLWARVGGHVPPDMFEPGRMHAVGIFLGQRGPGYAVNIISAMRRRDRIMLVFEERGPPAFMMAQRSMAPPPPLPPPPQPRMEPTARALSAGPSGPSYGVSNSFAPSGVSGFGPPPPPAPMPPQMAPVASRPVGPPPGPPTSPWAIVLINRGDLPVIVEQRLFR